MPIGKGVKSPLGYKPGAHYKTWPRQYNCERSPWEKMWFDEDRNAMFPESLLVKPRMSNSERVYNQARRFEEVEACILEIHRRFPHLQGRLDYGFLNGVWQYHVKGVPPLFAGLGNNPDIGELPRIIARLDKGMRHVAQFSVDPVTLEKRHIPPELTVVDEYP